MGSVCSTKSKYGVSSATIKPVAIKKSCLVNQGPQYILDRDRSLLSGPLQTQQIQKSIQVSVSTQTSLPYTLGALIDHRRSLYSLSDNFPTHRQGFDNILTKEKQIKNCKDKTAAISQASLKSKSSKSQFYPKILPVSESVNRLPALIDKRNFKLTGLDSI